MASRKTIPGTAAVIIALLLAGCGRGEKEKFEVNTGLAARVGDVKITQKEIDDRFEKMGPQLQARFKGKEGRARFVDTVIDEELLYFAAKDSDVRYDDEVKEQLRQAEKNVLILAYVERKIRQNIEVTDDEIEQYYNEHWNEFLNRAIIKAQHLFSTDSMKVVEWKRRIESGEMLGRIALDESEDKTTAPANGNLGYFNPGGYVKFYGDSKEFSDQIAHLEAGDLSDVVVTEKGYSLVRINDKKPEAPKPLAEVRGEILEKIRSEKSRKALDRELASLKDRHRPVNMVREQILATTRSPEELWQMAQEEATPHARIQYYRNIVNLYPDHQYAPQALFMIGFVYAEEIEDLVQARRTFDELMRSYPDAEVAESAKWMKENLETAHPKFETIEQMQERMREDKGQ